MDSIKAVFEQAAAARVAVADAVRTAHEEGLSAGQIADQAGVARGVVTSILHSPRALPPVIYLRGRGARPEDWAELERLLSGYHITRDRTQAWHLARGGHRVVLCDFTPVGAQTVRVGVVEAKCDHSADVVAGGKVLALPMVAGGVDARPTRRIIVEGAELPQVRLDVSALARMVLSHAGALGEAAGDCGC